MAIIFTYAFHLVVTLSLVIQVSCIFKHIPVCDVRRGLTREQVTLCNDFGKHMVYILDGSRLSMNECRNQFSGRKWNCTFPPLSLTPFLHPPMPLATRETSFVHSVVSAGIMHTLSRACMENKLSSYCACSEENRPANLASKKVWGGCGDNLPYGYRFSKKFMDASEDLAEESLDFSKVLMNLHNNEAGRWAVFKKSIIQCRCHGASSNCATSMCYRQLNNFKEVGKYLESRYQSSIQVKLAHVKLAQIQKTEKKLVEVGRSYLKYTSRDLIYLNESPSYCKKNLGIGSFGTKGRECQVGSNTLNDCSIVCCGRKHYTRRQIVKKKCGCKFIWCCEVRCETCEKEQNTHYCT